MHINIRPFEPSDLKDLHAFYCLPEVAQETSQKPYLSAAQVAALFSAPDRHTLVAERAEAQESIELINTAVIGNITLFLSAKPRQKHVAALAIAVSPSCQNLGVGKRLMQHAIDQADNWLNLLRLELDVYADNLNAIRLYEKMGFEHEGRKIKAGFKAGSYVDVLTMARIKPDAL